MHRWEKNVTDTRIHGTAKRHVGTLFETVERGARYLLGKVRHVGPHATRWAEATLQEHGVREIRRLEDFDFTFNPSIKKNRIYDLATCQFIRDRRDALLVGPPRTGKSHLVQAIGLTAIRSGFTVFYRSIFDTVRDFLHDKAMAGQEKVLQRYLKPDVLIIDDMGMKVLPKRSGEYLFEIVMRRHEVKATVMTSNRPLEEWGKLIGDVATPRRFWIAFCITRD